MHGVFPWFSQAVPRRLQWVLPLRLIGCITRYRLLCGLGIEGLLARGRGSPGWDAEERVLGGFGVARRRGVEGSADEVPDVGGRVTVGLAALDDPERDVEERQDGDVPDDRAPAEG